MDRARRRLLLATLRGQLLCHEIQAAGSAAGSPAVSLRQLWAYDARAPVVGTPALDASAGSVLVGTVAGLLHIVSAAGALGDPRGCLCNHVSTADTVRCWPSPDPDCLRVGAGQALHVLDLAAAVHLPVHVPQSQSAAVAACEDGTLSCIDTSRGRVLWRRALPAACRGLSNLGLAGSASRAAGGLDHQAPKRLKEAGPQHLLACTASGSLHVLDARTGQDTLQPARLPCKVFCQPAVAADLVWLGGRDDHLYCLQLGGS